MCVSVCVCLCVRKTLMLWVFAVIRCVFCASLIYIILLHIYFMLMMCMLGCFALGPSYLSAPSSCPSACILGIWLCGIYKCGVCTERKPLQRDSFASIPSHYHYRIISPTQYNTIVTSLIPTRKEVRSSIAIKVINFLEHRLCMMESCT